MAGLLLFFPLGVRRVLSQLPSAAPRAVWGSGEDPAAAIPCFFWGGDRPLRGAGGLSSRWGKVLTPTVTMAGVAHVQ